MLIDVSPLGMNSNGGGLTPISTAIVETDNKERNLTGATVFRKFRTDDGHTWCSVSGFVDGDVSIPSGYRPNKESIVCYIRVGSYLVTDRIIVKANADTISPEYGVSGKPAVLVGDNVWQVS